MPTQMLMQAAAPRSAKEIIALSHRPTNPMYIKKVLVQSAARGPADRPVNIIIERNVTTQGVLTKKMSKPSKRKQT